MRLPKTIGAFALWGGFLDLAIFVASFVFFQGAHGPKGPMFVLGVLNAPVRGLADRLWPAETSTNVIDAIMMFVVVLLNGAAYGFLVGVVVKAGAVLRARPTGRR